MEQRTRVLAPTLHGGVLARAETGQENQAVGGAHRRRPDRHPRRGRLRLHPAQRHRRHPAPTPGPHTGLRPARLPACAVPSGYLGTWTASIDNSRGHNTRSLTITQGEVGDTVLNLVATGPTDTGAYQCAFVATLAEQPSNAALLRIGPSRVTSGEPASYCTPGAATTLTLLPNGTLQRVTAGSGERLTYEKES